MDAWQTRLKPWLPTVVAVLLSLFLIGVVWQQRVARYHNDLAADFAYETREFALRLSEHLAAYQQILHGSRAFVAAAGSIQQEQWQYYAKNLTLQKNYPGVSTLGVIANLALSDVAEHEQRMREHGFSHYQITPPCHEVLPCTPIVRIQGFTTQQLFDLGFNTAALPSVLHGLQQSAAAGTSVISQQEFSQLLFFVQPIYQTNLPSGVPPSFEQVNSWAFLTFSMQGLVQEALGQTLNGVGLEIYAQQQGATAATPAISPQRIFKSQEFTPMSVETSAYAPAYLNQTATLNLGNGQTWELKFTGLPRNFKPLSWWSGEILVVVLICLTSVFGVVLITLLHLSSQRLMKMTKELQASEERYQFMATHDALTKVGNRALFHSSLENSVLQAERHPCCFAVIYIDLDKFKAVNDTLGHNYGDMLLIQVTQRVKSVIRKSDLLARNGGDEFVILLGRLQEAADSQRIAKKVCAVLAQPFTLEDQVVGIAGSLGIAVYPEDANTVEGLVNCADARMYLAKKAGGNRYVFTDKK